LYFNTCRFKWQALDVLSRVGGDVSFHCFSYWLVSPITVNAEVIIYCQYTEEDEWNIASDSDVSSSDVIDSDISNNPDDDDINNEADSNDEASYENVCDSSSEPDCDNVVDSNDEAKYDDETDKDEDHDCNSETDFDEESEYDNGTDSDEESDYCNEDDINDESDYDSETNSDDTYDNEDDSEIEVTFENDEIKYLFATFNEEIGIGNRNCTQAPGGVTFTFPNFTDQLDVNANSTVNFRVHAQITDATRATNFTEMRFEWRRNGEIWQGIGGTGTIPASDIINPGFGNIYLQLQGPSSQEERGGEWKLCVIIIGDGGTEIFRDCTHTVTVSVRVPGGNNNGGSNGNNGNNNGGNNGNNGNDTPGRPFPSPMLIIISDEVVSVTLDGVPFPLNQAVQTNPGQILTFRLTPNVGYRFLDAVVSVRELVDKNYRGGYYIFTYVMPTEDSQITPTFDRLPENDFPLRWPSDSGEVTLWFGIVDSVYRAIHQGIDIQGVLRSTVYSVADGIITDIYDSPSGRVVVTDFMFNGQFMQSRHINVNAISVNIGDSVTRGQTIGVKGLNPSHEEIVKGKLEIQLIDADGQEVDPMNFMIRPPYDIDYLTRPMAYSMLSTSRARAFTTTLESHRRFMANLDLNQELGEVYLWRAAYNFVISQGQHITPEEFAASGYLSWDGETRVATFQFQDIFMQWVAPVVEFGITPAAGGMNVGRIENDRIVVFPNPFIAFLTDVEWLTFSHPETDTEIFISSERVSSFDDFEDVLVGITRFLGNTMGNVYVLDGSEWHFQGMILLEDIGIIGLQERFLPPGLLPPALAQWIRNALARGNREAIDNPFFENYLGDFSLEKLTTLFFDLDTGGSQVESWLSLLESLIMLKSSSQVTPELLADVRSFHEELDNLEWWNFGENDYGVYEPSPLAAYEPIPFGLSGITPMFDYSEHEQARLVVLAGVLSLNDGLNARDFGRSTYYGELARRISYYFCDNEIFCDNWDNPQRLLLKSFRHFSWNYLVTARVNERTARISTTNREWAERLIVFRDAYEQRYINNGENIVVARELADSMTVRFRNNLIGYIQDNPEVFFEMIPPENLFFNVHNMLDLWNNERGRIYGLSSTGLPAFVFTPPEAPGPGVNVNIPSVRNHLRELFEYARSNNHIVYHQNVFSLRETWEIILENGWWLSVR